MSVIVVAIFVIVGVPGPIFGIGFGCLIKTLWVSALVVTSGKLLGDIFTYYLVKCYMNCQKNDKLTQSYYRNK